MTEARDWDPAPQEKEWFRESSSGNLGWKVKRDGIWKIRLDRAMEEVIRPYRDGEWVPEKEKRPMTVAQVGEICFLADRRLITYTESPGLKKDWHDLSDDLKIQWMERGPTKGDMRVSLYKGIKEALAPFYR
jgi:hypothetical protein